MEITESGNSGLIWGLDLDDTYSVDKETVTLSYSKGYKLCSMTLNQKKDRMSGTCINKEGVLEKNVSARLIDY